MKKFIFLLITASILSASLMNLALAGTWSWHSDRWESYMCEHPEAAYWTGNAEKYSQVCR